MKVQRESASSDDVLLKAFEAHQDTMREFLRSQEQVMRLFLDHGAEEPSSAPRPARNGISHHAAHAPETPRLPMPAAPQPVAQGAPGSIEPEPVREAPAAAPLEQILLKIASEKSGYPADMLGPDLDIEAELGVDSIQRLDIIDSFLSALPDAVQARAKEGVSSLSKAKTLRSIVEIVNALAPPAAGHGGDPQAKPLMSAANHVPDPGADVADRARAPGKSVPESGDLCPRYTMQASPAATARRRSLDTREMVILTADRGQLAGALAEKLQDLGARTVVIPAEALGSRAQIVDHLHGQLAAPGWTEISVLHLASADALPVPSDIADWRRQSDIVVKSLFSVLQEIGQAHVRRVLSISQLGGWYGRNGECGPGSPLAGGNAGLLNSLRLEWPRTQCRTIDFQASLSPSVVSGYILDELLSTDAYDEVGYSDAGRHVFAARPAPLAVSQPVRPAGVIAPDSVVLVTGGARGITAEVVSSFAQPGMKIVIVGRTPLLSEEENAAAPVDAQDLKAHFIAELRRSGASVTPAMVSEAVADVTRKREADGNIARMRGLGATVEYVVGDVRNHRDFSQIIADVYKNHGRIDTAIHGAGVIDDKLLADKTPESFDRVVGAKLDGLFTLSRALDPATLKHLVLFSSTAGRFGNEGQSDYGAANEVMNRFAWRLAADWPQTRVVSINWGPWDNLGMVSPLIREKFLQNGIVPIDRTAGCDFLLRELGHGSRSDVEVIAGQGPWETGVRSLASRARDAEHSEDRPAAGVEA
jgi:NAD(P)-dependent dehydrogenase (short-subunit alcohol dehydrogenase family)